MYIIRQSSYVTCYENIDHLQQLTSKQSERDIIRGVKFRAFMIIARDQPSWWKREGKK